MVNTISFVALCSFVYAKDHKILKIH